MPNSLTVLYYDVENNCWTDYNTATGNRTGVLPYTGISIPEFEAVNMTTYPLTFNFVNIPAALQTAFNTAEIFNIAVYNKSKMRLFGQDEAVSPSAGIQGGKKITTTLGINVTDGDFRGSKWIDGEIYFSYGRVWASAPAPIRIYPTEPVQP